MTYKVKLTKRYRPQDAEGGLRTDIIEGETEALPVVDSHFNMTAPPLTPGAFLRLVSTSRVTKINNISENCIKFNTMSGSEYQIDIT